MNVLDLRRVEAGFHRACSLTARAGAALVEDGNVARRAFAARWRRRGSGCRRSAPASMRPGRVEQHRRRGFLFLAHEDGRLPGSPEVNARSVPRRQPESSATVRLQGALVIDLFGELADAELLVFHQFETDCAAPWEAPCEARRRRIS